MSSLPVPVSPVIKTAEFVGATCATSRKAEISGTEVPTMASALLIFTRVLLVL